MRIDDELLTALEIDGELCAYMNDMRLRFCREPQVGEQRVDGRRMRRAAYVMPRFGGYYMTAAFANMGLSGPTWGFVAVLIVVGSLTGLILGQSGHFDAVDVRVGMDPHMSEESRSLLAQAKIASCLADEARRMLDGWMFDLRALRGHASSDYVAGWSA